MSYRNVPASTNFPCRFEPRIGEYGRRVFTDGDPVFTVDGKQIVQGLRVFTNNLDRGWIDLSSATYDWHEPEQRWQLWFDVWIDHTWDGKVVTSQGKREMQSDCRVVTRYDGKEA